LAREAQIHEARVSELLEGVRRWSGKPLEVVQRVDLGAEEMTVHVNLSRFLGEEDAVVRHVIPARIRRRGVEMRLVLDSAQDQRVPTQDPVLIRAVVRAHRWFDDIVNGRARSLAEIAEKEGVSDRYVGHLMPLAFLAPDIVAAIFTGTHPVDLTTERLTKRTDLPLGWIEQKSRLGFD
jgi:hypothetical protein